MFYDLYQKLYLWDDNDVKAVQRPKNSQQTEKLSQTFIIYPTSSRTSFPRTTLLFVLLCFISFIFFSKVVIIVKLSLLVARSFVNRKWWVRRNGWVIHTFVYRLRKKNPRTFDAIKRKRNLDDKWGGKTKAVIRRNAIWRENKQNLFNRFP